MHKCLQHSIINDLILLYFTGRDKQYYDEEDISQRHVVSDKVSDARPFFLTRALDSALGVSHHRLKIGPDARFWQK